METTPITPKGLEKLKRQLAEVEGKLPGVTRRMAAAREMGDLSENAEYHAAREEIAWLNSQADNLRGRIAGSRVVDTSGGPRDLAALGALVRLEDLSNGRPVAYRLVGEGESDPVQRRILTTSPIGRALLRKKVGDEVEVQVPRGLLKYRVTGIEFE